MPNTVKQENLAVSLLLADLAKRDATVYVPLHGHVTPDLLVIKDGVVLRIEVKGFSDLKDTANVYPQQKDRYDVLAKVGVTTGEIRYIPELEVAVSSVRLETLTEKERNVILALRA